MKKVNKERGIHKPADNFFTPLSNTKPYFRAAFQGFAGSGKTYTAALVALGLHQMTGSKNQSSFLIRNMPQSF